MREIGRELLRLPLVLRCVVIGGSCTGTIAAAATVINVIRTYPADHVVQAALFGIFEALVLAGAVGAVLGLAVGVVAYLTRSAVRGVAHRRS